MSSPELIRKRKELHRHPELSGREEKTAARIEKWLKKLEPDELLTGLGGTGILARFNASGDSQSTVLFRAELDAIAVNEESDFPYRSEFDNIMHGCGHDGHMMILLGFAQQISEKPPEHVDVLILYQPAEESGEGAAGVLADPRFQSMNIDHAFALHNLPGYEENSVVLKEGVFACASAGFEVSLRGQSSHAAYPEQGTNPADEIAAMLTSSESVFNSFREKNDFNKAVCSYVQMGNRAFGISPGSASIGFTLRSPQDDQMQEVLEKLKESLNKTVQSFEGSVAFQKREPFSATINDAQGVRIVREAAKKAGLKLHEAEDPFPWSEDFGNFSQCCPLTLFGLGSGINHPPLHSERYDFNDRIMDPGIELFLQIVKLYDRKSKNV